MLTFPLGLPIAVTEKTRTGYDYIETLQPGDVALLKGSFGATGVNNYNPCMLAHTIHLHRLGCKALYYTSASDGVEMWFRMMDQFKPDEKGWVYGEDYVFFGIISGGESTIAAMMADMKGTKPTDYYGTPLEELPLMQQVNGAVDLKLVCVYSGGDDNESWIRQAYTRYGTPVLTTTVAVCTVSLMPFWTSGQLIGLNNDVVGVAEYESLIDFKGRATQICDVLSLAQTVVLAFMVTANLGLLGRYLTSRNQKKEVSA
jgi:hypothetical protein